MGGGVRLFDCWTGYQFGVTLRHGEEYPMAFAFNRRGDRLAVGYQNGDVLLFDLDRFEEMQQWQTGSGVTGLEWSQGGEELVVVGFGDDVCLCQKGGELRRSEKWHEKGYDKICISDRGEIATTGVGDGRVVVWNRETLRPQWSSDPGQFGTRPAICFLPRSSLLAVAYPYTVAVVDVDRDRLTHYASGRSRVGHMSVASDGSCEDVIAICGGVPGVSFYNRLWQRVGDLDGVEEVVSRFEFCRAFACAYDTGVVKVWSDIAPVSRMLQVTIFEELMNWYRQMGLSRSKARLSPVERHAYQLYLGELDSERDS